MTAALQKSGRIISPNLDFPKFYSHREKKKRAVEVETMGGDASRIMTETGLTRDEVLKLREKFDWLAKAHDCDLSKNHHTVDRKSFLNKFPMPQRDLALRIFNAMDVRRSGNVSFSSFCHLVTVLAGCDVDKQLDLLFKVYDGAGTGAVTRQDVESVVQDLYHCSAALWVSIGYDDTDIKSKTAREKGAVDQLMKCLLLQRGGMGGTHEHSNLSCHENHTASAPADSPLHKYATPILSADDECEVGRDQFTQFALSHPSILTQLKGVFSALQSAAGWSWQKDRGAVRKRPSWCAIS